MRKPQTNSLDNRLDCPAARVDVHRTRAASFQWIKIPGLAKIIPVKKRTGIPTQNSTVAITPSAVVNEQKENENDSPHVPFQLVTFFE